MLDTCTEYMYWINVLDKCGGYMCSIYVLDTCAGYTVTQITHLELADWAGRL